MALDLTVPANLTGLVHLPATSASQVREGGVAAGQAPGVVGAFGRRRSGRARGRQRELPLHEQLTLGIYDEQVVPDGGVAPDTKYVCTSPRTHAL